MNEYIAFSEPLSVVSLQDYLLQIGMSSSFSSNISDNKIYKGISDGRFAKADTICFVDRVPVESSLKNLETALVITNNELHVHFQESEAIYTDDPRALFIKLLEIFDKQKKCLPFSSKVARQIPYIAPDAMVDPRAILEEGVSVGKGTVISAGVVLKRGTVIGENCIIRENCTIGCNGIALYKSKSGDTLRFPHLAGVQIGNNVELGAGVVVVKGTLLNTVIEDDTVIGNLCNIGHGVKIGKKVWMSVGSLVGGNCNIAKDSTIGLGVRIRDNLKIGENVSVGMGSVVTKNLPSDISVFGNPAKKIRSLTTGPKR